MMNRLGSAFKTRLGSIERPCPSLKKKKKKYLNLTQTFFTSRLAPTTWKDGFPFKGFYPCLVEYFNWMKTFISNSDSSKLEMTANTKDSLF
jgi:hypothetical protein